MQITPSQCHNCNICSSIIYAPPPPSKVADVILECYDDNLYCFLLFRTKWKRQTSLGLEMMTEPPRATEPPPYSPPYGPQAALELYYQAHLRNLPLLSPLMLPNTRYSAYLAQLAARARNASSSSASPPPTSSSPPSNRGSTPSPSPPRREGRSPEEEKMIGQ